MPLPAAVVSQTGEVIVDVACRACGYNLRGLPASGVCPECACPLARSLLPPSLSTAPSRWLRTLERGAVVLLVGLVLLVPGIFLYAMVPVNPGRVSRWGDASCMLLMLLVAGLGLVLLTVPDAEEQEEPVLSARRLARWGLLAALGMTLILPLLTVAQSPALYFTARLATLLLYALGAPGLLSYTRGLFLAAGWQGWATFSQVTGVGLLVAVMLPALASLALVFVSNLAPTAAIRSGTMCCGWVSTIPFGICGLVVLGGLCRCLAEAHRGSRRHTTIAEFEQQRARKVKTETFYPP